jgi:predicted  nucleic acid-binding Zn-ribbon protein
MPAEDYFVPTDLDAMRMENELLTLENTFLKGRVLSLEQDLRAAREREAQTRRALERVRTESEKRPAP